MVTNFSIPWPLAKKMSYQSNTVPKNISKDYRVLLPPKLFDVFTMT
jgi:hypothetical protein